jgi:hypothetical protein
MGHNLKRKKKKRRKKRRKRGRKGGEKRKRCNITYCYISIRNTLPGERD